MWGQCSREGKIEFDTRACMFSVPAQCYVIKYDVIVTCPALVRSLLIFCTMAIGVTLYMIRCMLRNVQFFWNHASFYLSQTDLCILESLLYCKVYSIKLITH